MPPRDAGTVSPETVFNGAMLLAEGLTVTTADMTTGTVFLIQGSGEDQMRRAAESPPPPTPMLLHMW